MYLMFSHRGRLPFQWRAKACGGLCAVLATIMASLCLASDFQIIQIADENYINRSPVISDTGIAAWYAYEQDDAKGSQANIFIYRDGKRSQITSSVLEANIRPRIWKNTIVWQGPLHFEVGDGGKGRPLVTQIPENIDAADDFTRGGSIDVTELPGEGIEPSSEQTEAPENSSTNNFRGRSEWDVYMWKDGQLVAMVPGDTGTGFNPINGIAPSCSDNFAAWQFPNRWPCGWEIMIWNDGDLIKLTTNCYYDMSPQVYEKTLTWFGWDGQDFEIFYYDSESTNGVVQITDNSYDDVNPVIWEDKIAWEAYPAVEADIFLWENQQILKLSQNLEDDVSPRIWNGNVVWQGLDGEDYEIYLYDGERTIKLTNNEYDDVEPDIRDNRITWVGYYGNWDAEVFLHNMDNHETVRLTDNDLEDRHPRTSGGRVVWEGKREGLPLIFYAEPTAQ